MLLEVVEDTLRSRELEGSGKQPTATYGEKGLDEAALVAEEEVDADGGWVVEVAIKVDCNTRVVFEDVKGNVEVDAAEDATVGELVSLEENMDTRAVVLVELD